MTKTLNCIGLQETFLTLNEILEANVVDFLNVYNNKIYFKDQLLYFDRITVKDIKSFFRVDKVNFERVHLHHVAAILDKESYLEHGLLNLEQLAKRENGFKDFLKNFNIDLKITEENIPFFEYKGKKVKSPYLDYRASQDRCINGFLLGRSCYEDTNIEELRNCPEILKVLSEEISEPKIIELWKKYAVPSVVSVNINVSDLQEINFGIGEQDTKHDFHNYLILGAINYLVITDSPYPYEHIHPMLFLKEGTSIPANNIVSIKLLDEF